MPCLKKACYALGFVTSDGDNRNVPLQDLIDEPDCISAYDFVGLRRIIHTLWRAEWWNSQSVPSGANPTSEAVRSRALHAISRRLRELVEAARSAARDGA
jgi:hypothetical protein